MNLFSYTEQIYINLLLYKLILRQNVIVKVKRKLAEFHFRLSATNLSWSRLFCNVILFLLTFWIKTILCSSFKLQLIKQLDYFDRPLHCWVKSLFISKQLHQYSCVYVITYNFFSHPFKVMKNICLFYVKRLLNIIFISWLTYMIANSSVLRFNKKKSICKGAVPL